MNQELLEVKRVEFYKDHLSDTILVNFQITVSNSWAYRYGKISTNQLSDAINYFKNVETVEPRSPPAEESEHCKLLQAQWWLIKGAMHYDHLNKQMKFWNGTSLEILDL
jgi:hypothetical protein